MGYISVQLKTTTEAKLTVQEEYGANCQVKATIHVMQVHSGAGCISADTRPDQLHWGDIIEKWECYLMQKKNVVRWLLVTIMHAEASQRAAVYT